MAAAWQRATAPISSSITAHSFSRPDQLRFREFLEPLIAQEIVACWHARFAELQRDTVIATMDWDDTYPHYVGAPRMNAIGRYLADGLTIRQNTTVAQLDREAAGWSLADSDGNSLGSL